MATHEVSLKVVPWQSAFRIYLMKSEGLRMAAALLFVSLLLAVLVAMDILRGVWLSHGGVRPIGIVWVIVFLVVRHDIKKTQREYIT